MDGETGIRHQVHQRFHDGFSEATRVQTRGDTSRLVRCAPAMPDGCREFRKNTAGVYNGIFLFLGRKTPGAVPDNKQTIVRAIKREYYFILRPQARTIPRIANAPMTGIVVRGVFVVVGISVRPSATGVLWPPVTVTVWEASVYPACRAITT